jgi:hypothetical protein
VRRLSPCGQRRGRQTVTESAQQETRGQRRSSVMTIVWIILIIVAVVGIVLLVNRRRSV